jgi:hypothetical protein
MARMCASLKARLSDDPRCPLVPKLVRHRRIRPIVEVELARSRDVDEDFARCGLPGEWMDHGW